MSLDPRVQAHPLNLGFQWRGPQPPFKRITSEEASLFDENGFVIIKDALSPETLDRLERVLDIHDARMERALARSRTKRFVISFANKFTVSTHIAAQDAFVRDFAHSPLLTELSRDLMGGEVQLYHDQLVYKKPDPTQTFPWHQDNGYVYLEPQQYISCWIPLVDATEENGCPWVLPGLHRLGTLHHTTGPHGYVCTAEEWPAQARCCPVKAGDILVFSSLCPHMTGPNTSAGVRKAYLVQYCDKRARRVLHSRVTARRYASLRVRSRLEYAIMKCVLRPALMHHFYRYFG